MEKENGNSAFYIGWQEKMPEELRGPVKKMILGIGLITLLVCGAFVFSQNEFENSNFELGNITEIEGILVMDPVPMLKILAKPESDEWKSVLLIGFGKFGAEKTIETFEASYGKSLIGKAVKLSGTRIYHHDKYAFELTEGKDSFKGVIAQEIDYTEEKELIGDVNLFGEILDPKCALGVMKPGFGKIHRSCAIRCISGGIPPVLRIQNQKGESNYILLKGSANEAINTEVLPFIADQMRVCGRLERVDDWLVLYTNPQEDFLRLQPHWMKGDVILCSK